MNQPKAKGIMFLACRIMLQFKKRIFFLAFCIALGVSFLFAVGNLTEIITQEISGEARSILTADVEVYSYQKFTSDQNAIINSYHKKEYQVARTTTFTSMVRTKTKSFLASIKGIEDNFPLYGDLEITPNNNFSSGDCWVDQNIRETHNLELGETIHIGEASFRIMGFITKEPGRIFGSIAFAPRIIIPFEDVGKTKLTEFGSRVRYSAFIAIPMIQNVQEADRLYETLQNQFTDNHTRVTSYKNTQTNISNVMQRQSYFFLLVSVVTLIIGIVGMSASMTTFLHDQQDEVGTFRALGMETSAIFKIYLMISLLVGVIGGLLGCSMGYLFSTIGLESIIQVMNLNIDIEMAIFWQYFIEAIFISVFLTVFINIIKIYALAKTSPMDVIRGETKNVPYPVKAQMIIMICLVVLLYFYIYYKSNFELAMYFSGAVVVVTVITYLFISLAFYVFTKIWRLLPTHSFIVKNGIRQLVRQKSRNRIFLLSLTIGFTLIFTLNMVHNSLTQELFFLKKTEVPNIFLANIYPVQLNPLQEILDHYDIDSQEYSPLIRARLKTINGTTVERENELQLTDREKEVYRWRIREYNLTYKDTLNESEEIIAGSFWQNGEDNPHISLEKDFARRANLNIGDILEFDIQGRSIEGKVTSIRKINWMSMKPNFFVIMPQSVLQKAPQNIIASFRMKKNEEIKNFQEESTKKYPNITVINVNDIMNVVYTLLNYFLSALQITAWFCIAVGIIILAGTMITGYNDKLDQVALFKTMGCTKKQIILMDICEFIGIGFISATISIAMSLVLTLLHNHQLDIETHISQMVFYYLCFVIFLPVITGVLVNRKTYKATVGSSG